MSSICLYFQVHQPYRLKKYTIFDSDHDAKYFDDEANKNIIRNVANKCYLPANKLLLQMIRNSKGAFRVAFSISGTALEQFSKYCPDVMASFRALALTGCVEFLAETYYHSLAGIYSQTEFDYQVKKHHQAIEEYFNYSPTTFRNTELIYNDQLAGWASALGYKCIMAEGVESVLDWRKPDYLYRSAAAEDLTILFRNYKLSDDIAYRFSNRAWSEYPLTANKYAKWLAGSDYAESNVLNLFMDYETFGEHHWENTGIFHFLWELPKEVGKITEREFLLPSEVAKKYPVGETLSIPKAISWADKEKDLSAWLGNDMQKDAVQNLYDLIDSVKNNDDERVTEDWRKLTTTDHLYYISTKAFEDGSVHSYFSPYSNPYEAFINYMNVLQNLKQRLGTQPVLSPIKLVKKASNKKILKLKKEKMIA